MFGTIKNEFCPRCGNAKMTMWDDLTADQRAVALARAGERAAERAKLKKHRVCTRCFEVLETDDAQRA